MPKPGLNFYATNAQRRYPLDDAASAETDDGLQLPPDILVDCYLMFPEAVGRYAFVSSVHASRFMVSITFLAADHPAKGSDCGGSYSSSDAPPEFVPLGAVTVPRDELIEGRQYPIEAMYPGVGGWVVFGPCRQESTFSGLFSTVEQSMLSTRIARSYEALPVDGMGKLANAELLTGLVQLEEGPDISITKETREIDGIDREVIVIALANVPGRNTLDIYRGPCSGRPESGTCLVPAIESINAVTPDCNGNIEIDVISDCAAVFGTDSGGLLIDYCLGLGEACTEDDMPLNGKLPNDYDDYCVENEWSSEILNEEEGIFVIYGTQWGGKSYSLSSSFELPCVDFPFYDDFSDGGASYFVTQSGAFSCVDGAFKATKAGHRNIAIWEGCTFPTMLTQTLTIEFILNSAYGRPNAGMVLDWKDLAENESYYVIEADKSTDSFRVRFWNGQAYVMVDRRQGMNIRFGQQYAIVVENEEHDAYVRVTAQLREDDAYGQLLGQIVFDSRRMKLPGGHVGLIADNSEASFMRFMVGTPLEANFSSGGLESSADESGYSSLEPCDLPLDRVIAYWGFNDNYFDGAAGVDFDNTGDVTFVAGPLGRRAVRLTDGSSLSTERAETLSLGMHAITICGWVKFNELPEVPTMIWGKFQNQWIEWIIYADQNSIHGIISENGSTEFRFSPKIETLGPLQAGQWYFFCMTYDRESRTVEFEVNADHRKSYGFNQKIAEGGFPLHVGKKPILWMPGDLEADVAELAIFDVALSRRQRECLYQTGVDPDELDDTVSNPFVPESVPDPVSFWRLNEASDFENRRDLMNHNDLLFMVGCKSSTNGLIDGSSDFSVYGWPLFHENTSGDNDLSKGFASFSMGGWLYGPAPTWGEYMLAGVWCVDNGLRSYCLRITQEGYKAIVSSDGINDSAVSEYNELVSHGSRERFWRHVMMVFDHTTGKVTLYYNGQAMPASVAVATIKDSPAPFTMGSHCVVWNGPSGGYGATGAVPLTYDDWGWWDVALTADQIQTVYNNGNGWQPEV